MKRTIQAVNLLLLGFVAIGQTQENPLIKAARLFNQFSVFSYPPGSPDSAYKCILELAAMPEGKPEIADLIHNNFAARLSTDETRLDTTALQRYQLAQNIWHLLLASDNNDIRQIIEPIKYWLGAKAFANDSSTIRRLAQKYLSEQLNGDLRVLNRARYGLLIAQIIEKSGTNQPIHDRLIARISQLLSVKVNGNMVSSSYQDSIVWARAMLGYIHFIKAASVKGKEKIYQLRLAAAYGPQSLSERELTSSYSYDYFFFFPGEDKFSFNADFADCLQKYSPASKEILPLMTRTALMDPTYKPALQAWYQKRYKGLSFGKYWLASVNASAKNLPAFKFQGLDRTLPDTKKQNDKWVFIDFWGTWCPPCIFEHPDVQRLYDSTIAQHADKISMLAIACHDTEEKVTRYMNQYHYSFPVALSDSIIEKKMGVKGYPTKLLITPQGKAISIPRLNDWVTLVQAYLAF